MQIKSERIRYALVGLGHISQNAVLPAFKHAEENSELTCLISSDAEKLTKMSKDYNVASENCFSYEQFDQALQQNIFDAVYIALPNDMHKDFCIRAADAKKHILCEKPMAPKSADCAEMLDAAKSNGVKLMIAYRLHFEKTNMMAVDMIKAGKIGEPRLFNASFCLQVREGNIRTQHEHAGGPLYDIGIYCINASRYLFQGEPRIITSLMTKGSDPRFSEIEESVGALMQFDDGKLASFVSSFGARDVSRLEVIGTDGRIVLEPAFDYSLELEYTVESGKHKETHKTPKEDQFAPELIHFSDCIINNREPGPSGLEGIADVRVIEAIQESARSGQRVELGQIDFEPPHPDGSQIFQKPPVSKPPTVNVQSGSKD